MRAALLLLLGLLAGAAAAQDSVVIYRCTDATGAVSVQNDIPCAKGSQQQRRVIETERPTPAPPVAVGPVGPLVPLLPITDPAAGQIATADAATAAGEPGNPDEPALDTGSNPSPADLLPPPPLFSCRSWDRQILLTDNAVPAERCAPLETTGLGGDPAAGAGVACEIKRDHCEPVAEDQLCEQWRKYLNDTEAMLQFGRAPDPAGTRAEVERIGAIVDASTCRR
ncbi:MULTISPECIES: DUF4124 domain-containing protein [unclassified Lysobacter]